MQENLLKLKDQGVDVVALSVDPQDKAREMVEKNDLTFPVGYGLKAPEDADRIGAYYDEENGYIQPVGALLKPDNTIYQITYSSGPLGRLTAKNTAALLDHLTEKTTG